MFLLSVIDPHDPPLSVLVPTPIPGDNYISAPEGSNLAENKHSCDGKGSGGMTCEATCQTGLAGSDILGYVAAPPVSPSLLSYSEGSFPGFNSQESCSNEK